MAKPGAQRRNRKNQCRQHQQPLSVRTGCSVLPEETAPTRHPISAQLIAQPSSAGRIEMKIDLVEWLCAADDDPVVAKQKSAQCAGRSHQPQDKRKQNRNCGHRCSARRRGMGAIMTPARTSSSSGAFAFFPVQPIKHLGGEEMIGVLRNHLSQQFDGLLRNRPGHGWPRHSAAAIQRDCACPGRRRKEADWAGTSQNNRSSASAFICSSAKLRQARQDFAAVLSLPSASQRQRLKIGVNPGRRQRRRSRAPSSAAPAPYRPACCAAKPEK